MNNPIIETDIAEILRRIEDKQDRASEKLDQMDKKLIKIETKLETELPAIKENIKEFKDRQKTLVKDVSDLKGAKSLIIPIIVAVTTSLLTLLIRAIPAP